MEQGCENKEDKKYSDGKIRICERNQGIRNGEIVGTCGACPEKMVDVDESGGERSSDAENIEILVSCLGGPMVSEANEMEMSDTKSDVSEEDLGQQGGLLHRYHRLLLVPHEQNISSLSSGCLTPIGCVFDPFASCTGEPISAPRKKSPRPLRVVMGRRLKFDLIPAAANSLEVGDMEEEGFQRMECLRHNMNFDTSSYETDSLGAETDSLGDDALLGDTLQDTTDSLGCAVQDDATEEEMMDFIYRSIIGVIISKQVEKSSEQGLLAESCVYDGFKTPTAAPLSMIVDETCPGAPIRPSPRARELRDSICRKLEF